MQHLIAVLAAVLLLALPGHPVPAAQGGASVAPADAAAARAVIQGQLDAFAADDAAAAFAYAAPGIQSRFATPENFVAMVRSAYPVVWRPASVAFRGSEWDKDDLIQAVQMSDANGGVWMILYRLERQADRSWRIAGCQMVQGAGRSV